MAGGSDSQGSTASGPYTIGNGATLRVTANGFWFNGSPSFNFTSNGGGTIDTASGVNFIMGGNATYTSAGGARNEITGSSGINLNVRTATLDVARGTDATTDLLVSTAFSNTGSLVKTGNGIATLSGDNSYTGTTTITGGTLQVGIGGTSGSLGTGDVVNNATLVFNRSDNHSVSNTISGTGGLTKRGPGVTTLTGNNTYTGATTVAAGQLTVDGELASTATVQSGARIGGSGRVGGLILDSGSTLAPGNSPGTLSVSGNATWNSGANYNWQVLATNTDPAVQTGAGSGWDYLDVTGSLTFSGLDSSNRFNLNLWSLSSTSPDTNGTIPGWDPSVGSTWLIASAAGGINLNGTSLVANTNYSSLFKINTSATNGTGGWIGALPSSFQVLTLGDANSLYLQAVAGSAAVPEPGQVAASALLLIGIGGYVWVKRRKAAKAAVPA